MKVKIMTQVIIITKSQNIRHNFFDLPKYDL